MIDIFEAQKQFFKQGFSHSITYREHALKQLKKALYDHEQEIIEALKKDLNKHPKESYLSEIMMVKRSINFAIRNLHRWNKNKRKRTPLLLQFGKSYTRRNPYGVSLVMSAYNYPLLLSLDPLIGSISGGNTTMLALSKNSHYTNQVIIKMLNSIFPAQYIYAFETDRTLNTEILDYKFDKIFFTGSSKVGKVVLEKAAKNLINVTLELGGKSPVFVLRDANIKLAAENIVYSKMLNGGQTCVASDYVLVDSQIKDELVKAVEIAYRKMYPNYLNQPKMINENEFNRVLNIVKTDQNNVINDYEYNEKTHQMSLVMIEDKLENISSLACMDDEIFGPILPIIEYDDINKALKYVNESDVPLALYVFGKAKPKINYVLDNCEFGGASVNSTIFQMVNEQLPFSGVKQSGLGSYHGKYSFEAFTYEQAIYRKKGFNFQKVIYPPYK